ncbi:uncharacterized protein EI90DRAFT_2975353 [Cantharellus anzutake]|uniref:uncharacterized protein n=1 Tax=Cantharellus anzutake TaxID=1750568 RepID=UPI001903F792|nr:uncharacterized protein EI90DRAFT_2975353 [Cantharellus anzutake]KAF8326982.1 hypothetical protein EI90DRAFT_2975353 [Cantharellus anzutake]
MSLPVISITPWITDTSTSDLEERLQVSKQLHNACVDYGFFYLDISDFASAEETNELERLAREFFKLPQAVKDEISIHKQDHARGYQRLGENITQGKPDGQVKLGTSPEHFTHEGIDFYAPVDNPDPSRPLWGTNQWPEISGFRTEYERWVDKMKQLGLIVMEAMATGLGMDKDEWQDLRSQMDDSFWVMRLIGYPPLPNDHDGYSCGAHKDYGCLTFLYTDDTPSALQVWRGPTKDEAQGRWIYADPIPGCVIVNIGEMWEIWTNGLYRSTLHRVIHRGRGFRVSIPFFFEPNFDALVRSLPAASRALDAANSKESSVTNISGKIYEPVIYGDFLLSKVTNNFVGDRKGRYN